MKNDFIYFLFCFKKKLKENKKKNSLFFYFFCFKTKRKENDKTV